MGASIVANLPSDRTLDPAGAVQVLLGHNQGKYPHANSMLVQGTDGAVLIDPSQLVAERGGVPGRVDRMLVSHAHEDHLAGCSTFPTTPLHAHHFDIGGLHSLDGLLAVYGFGGAIDAEWRETLVRDFHYLARPDATGFSAGETFDLGSVRVEVVHLPGHTRGHCGFLVEPASVLYVADIDLTSFGPYYGDHWSDLEDFERSIAAVREIDAAWFVTSHHKGIIEGRAEFVEMLNSFEAVISKRETALLAFLGEPRSMADIVAHRFIYRPGTDVLWADHVEEVSMTMHLKRLVRVGAVVEVEPHTWRAAA